jgi:transposase
MKSKRKFTAEFKVKVALEALKERESVTELAKRYELHPNQINDWKKEFLAKAALVFSNGKSENGPSMDEKEKQQLYQTIGQLKVENDFLKKALS